MASTDDQLRREIIKRIESRLFSLKSGYNVYDKTPLLICEHTNCGECGLPNCNSSNIPSLKIEDVVKRFNLETYLEEHPEYLI